MDAAEIWRQKTDDELLVAGGRLDDYLADGQQIIRAEIARRGLTLDAPPTDVEPDQAPAAPAPIDGNPLLKLWLGGYSLPMSYWAFGWLGRMAWALILVIVIDAKNPGPSRAMVALLVLVGFVVYDVI